MKHNPLLLMNHLRFKDNQRFIPLKIKSELVIFDRKTNKIVEAPDKSLIGRDIDEVNKERIEDEKE